MPYIRHKFGETHYTVKGRGSKTPIIWLHGGPGGTHDPNGPIFSLAQGRKVYAYTQVGSGKSSKTKKALWNIKTFVDELEILIKRWKLKEFHLMGGSWGTTLALEYYLQKKGKGVKSIVFQSPLFNSHEWKQDGHRLIRGLSKKSQRVIKVCHEIGATDSKVYRLAMMEFYLKHVLRSKKTLEKLFEKPNPNGHAIYEYMWGPSEFEPTGTLKNYDKTKSLRRIKVPTLLICGQFDEATPRTGRKFSKLIPNCQFSEIKNASHVIWYEKPKEIKKVINSFLKDLE